MTALNAGGESDPSEVSLPIKAKPLKGRFIKLRHFVYSYSGYLHRHIYFHKIQPAVGLRHCIVIRIMRRGTLIPVSLTKRLFSR